MLSYNETGKYTSERHQAAIESGKLTAGEMAARLSKIYGEKITAKELKPLAPEWHHSGFYKPANGRSTMGRTYFFGADADPAGLIEQVLAARIAEPVVAQDKYYFVVGFERVRINSFGKLGYKPVARFEVAKDTPKNGTEITAEEFENARQYAGQRLEAYETFRQFKMRMEQKNANS